MVTIASHPVQQPVGIFADPLRLLVTTTDQGEIGAIRRAFQAEKLAELEITTWAGDSKFEKFEYMPTRRPGTIEALARTRVMLALGSKSRDDAAFILGLHIGISPFAEPRIEKEEGSLKVPAPFKEPMQWGLAVGAFLYETATGAGWFCASPTLALSSPAVETVTTEMQMYGENVNRTNSSKEKRFDPFAFFTGGRRNESEYVTEAVRQALYPHMCPKEYRKPRE